MPPGVDELITRDLDDVYLMIDHLSGRPDRSIGTVGLDFSDEPGRKVTKNLIDEVCRIRWPPKGDQAHGSKQAAVLFKARDKLNKLAAPATGLTIAYTLLVAPGEQGKRDLAVQAYPNLVGSANNCRRWIALLLGLMIAAVIATSFFSWYVAYGRLVLLRIEQLDRQRVEIATAFDVIEAGGPAPGQPGPAPAHGAPSEAWLLDEPDLAVRGNAMLARTETNTEKAARIQRVLDAVEPLRKKRHVADQALDEWNYYWRWLRSSPVWNSTESGPTEDHRVTLAERREQWSANLLAILGNYVLPMMYGFLGAAAAAMLNLNQKIRSARLSPRDPRMNQVQLVLGVITGACIGLFLTPSGIGASGATLSGSSVALSASALSFLAGFGVEGVFKMLQNISITAFGGQPHMQPSQPRP
jgi:hypothetical protein